MMYRERTDNPCGDIFNAAVAAYSISAGWELGILAELEQNETLDIAEFSVRCGLDQPTVGLILAALANVEIVSVDADLRVARPGRRFREAVRAKGLFYWLTSACGELFSALAAKTVTGNRVGNYAHRNDPAVAVASQEIGREFIDSAFNAVIGTLRFSKIADLGCGSGKRLCRMVDADADRHGVGIDISGRALALAHETVRAHGLDGQVQLIEADVTELFPRPELADVDMVTCLLMGHDFWPRENCVKTLRRMRDVFPAARDFLLVDTCRSEQSSCTDLPVFSIGFEVAHAVMGKYLPTLPEWQGVFGDGGWECVATHQLPLPPQTAIFHLRPGEDRASAEAGIATANPTRSGDAGT
jgi:SAM-dependent methyltransferase